MTQRTLLGAVVIVVAGLLGAAVALAPPPPEPVYTLTFTSDRLLPSGQIERTIQKIDCRADADLRTCVLAAGQDICDEGANFEVDDPIGVNEHGAPQLRYRCTRFTPRQPI